MKEDTQIPKKRISNFFSIVLFLMSIMLITASLQAQTNGTVKGVIFDSATEEYLPGANVILDGTPYGTSSDRDGFFRILNLPAGKYTLKAFYMGYDDYSVNVEIEQNGEILLDIPLKANYLQGEEVVVVGVRQGQIKALNQQQTALNIKSVVAKEQMETFPDLNTAEVLQRLPGISIDRDQGEGRYVLIRGTEARLSSTTVNGIRVPSPESKSRSVGLDVVSSNQLAAIEVTKAITPDMDGDAIGGAVNLVTKSAFDYRDRVIKFDVGSGYGNLRGKPLYQSDFTYADLFGENKNIGVTFSAGYHKAERGSDNNEMEWGGVDDVDENEIPFALQTLELRDYYFDRERYGASGALEYRLDGNNQVFFRGMYNYRTDFEMRNTLGFKIDDGDYNSLTNVSGAAIERHLKDRIENQVIYSFSAGGKHQKNKLGMDYNFSYNYAKQEKPDQYGTTFELDEDVDLTLNLSDPDLPKYTITNLDDGYEHNAANYVLDEIVYENNKTTDKNKIADLNFEYPYSFSAYQAKLKFGGKVNLKTKDQDDSAIEYGWEGDDDVLMSDLMKDGNSDYMDGEYNMGPAIDEEKIRDFFKANRDDLLEGEVNQEDTDALNFTATENIYAYYGMTTINIDKLMILAGIRHEITQNDYEGNEVVYDTSGDYQETIPAAAKSNYSNILPMVHFRYALTPKSNIRAAFTSGIARANYYDLVPYQVIFHEDEEVVMGNPDLETTSSYNFDLLGEHYFKGIGVLSGGFFYKSLDNIIYISTGDIESGDLEGYEFEKPVNGGSATLYGFEANWQQQLTFLPGFWNGFGLYANYTYTTSEADIVDRGKMDLPGQAGDVANFAVSYTKYGFMGRFSVKYHGKYIDEVGGDDGEDIFYDNHMQFDFTASQTFTKNARAYVHVVNMNNEPLRYYMGTTRRPIQREFYSWWVQAGLKISL